MITETLQVIYDLRWMLTMIAMLLLTDLWFGIADARRKRTAIRFSKAGRRTCCKAVEYLLYLVTGAILGLAVFEPLQWASHTVTAAVALTLAAVWEIDSILSHIGALHGKPNMTRRIITAVMRHCLPDVAQAVADELNTKNKEKWQTTNYSYPSSSDGKADTPTTRTTSEDRQTGASRSRRSERHTATRQPRQTSGE